MSTIEEVIKSEQEQSFIKYVENIGAESLFDKILRFNKDKALENKFIWISLSLKEGVFPPTCIIWADDGIGKVYLDKISVNTSEKFFQRVIIFLKYQLDKVGLNKNNLKDFEIEKLSRLIVEEGFYTRRRGYFMYLALCDDSDSTWDFIQNYYWRNPPLRWYRKDLPQNLEYVKKIL